MQCLLLLTVAQLLCSSQRAELSTQYAVWSLWPGEINTSLHTFTKKELVITTLSPEAVPHWAIGQKQANQQTIKQRFYKPKPPSKYFSEYFQRQLHNLLKWLNSHILNGSLLYFALVITPTHTYTHTFIAFNIWADMNNHAYITSLLFLHHCSWVKAF